MQTHSLQARWGSTLIRTLYALRLNAARLFGRIPKLWVAAEFQAFTFRSDFRIQRAIASSLSQMYALLYGSGC
eukprot:4585391-Prymnesium_polylepis.1